MDIAASISAISAAYALGKGLLSDSIDLATRDKIIQMQNALQEAQTVIHDLQMHRDKLQKDRDNHADFEVRKAQYTLKQMKLRSFKYWVYQHNEIKDLNACPVCMDKDQLILPLQNDGRELLCTNCNFALPIIGVSASSF